MEPEILYEDQDILVCVKPAGMATQEDRSMDVDLVSFLKNRMRRSEPDRPVPELYVVHRLDRPVGGIVVLARNRKAAAELGEQVRDGRMEKYYRAVLTGELPDWEGVLVDHLEKDGKTNTSSVVPEGSPKGKRAELEYEVLDVLETEEGVISYVLIRLVTGRHHQIRVQMANRNAGIWGDTKYNPRFQKTRGTYRQIGLYATRLCFAHPATGEPMKFQTEPVGEAFDLLDADEV